MRDHGGQPTSLAGMEVCSPLGSHHALTRSGTPQGHAETDRFLRTLTEACLGLREWTRPVELIRALEGWRADDHEHSRHATLGDKPPTQCAREDYRRHGPPCLAARFRGNSTNVPMTRLLKWITERGLDSLEKEDPPEEKEGLRDVKYRKGVCPTCGAERQYGRQYTLAKLRDQ